MAARKRLPKGKPQHCPLMRDIHALNVASEHLRDTDRIRELNDLFRKKGPIWASEHGLACSEVDGWYITDGVSDFGPLFVIEVVGAVQAFDAFNANNNPYGEHDFGVIEVAGQRVFWKIDYYDLTLSYDSPDPANSDVTRRTITIILAS